MWITEKIIKGKEEDQHLIIIGSLNGKICGRIKGNMPTVTKWRRQLIKIIDKYNMKLNKE